MNKQDFQQYTKITLFIGALILAVLWGLKILSIAESFQKMIEVKFGINYFVN